MMEALRIISGSAPFALMWLTLLGAIVILVLGWRQQRLTARQDEFAQEEKRASRAVTVIQHE